MSDFDNSAFLDWLDEQNGHVLQSDVLDEWPDFPFDALYGCTCPVVDGEIAYYQHDLRRIAENKPIVD